MDEAGGLPLSLPFVRGGYASMTGAPAVVLSASAATAVVRSFGTASPPLCEDGLLPDLAHAVDFLLVVCGDTASAPAEDLLARGCGWAAVEAVLGLWEPLVARGGWPPPARDEGLRLSLAGSLPGRELETLLNLSRRLWREVDFEPEPPAPALARLSEELVRLARGFAEVGDDEMALATGLSAGALGGQVARARERLEVWRRVCAAVPEIVEAGARDER